MSVVGRTAAPAAQHGHSWLWIPDRVRCAHLSGTTEIDSIFKQPILRPSLRGANGSRERAPDDRLRDEAIHSSFAWRDGLLRFARNDVKFQMRLRVLATPGARGFARTVRPSENTAPTKPPLPNPPI